MGLIVATQFVLLVSANERSVLFLNSYNLGYRWADEVSKGVLDEFASEKTVEVYTEFLDAKRFPSSALQTRALQLLNAKYDDKDFDAVLCSDNAALDFVLRFRGEAIFRDLPVVFCGITNVEDYVDEELLWGVQETHDFMDYIAEVHRLIPSAQRMHIVFNATETGMIYKSMFEDFEAGWEGKLEFVKHVGYKVSEIPARLGGLGDNDIVYYFTMTKDRFGEVVNSADFVDTLKEHCQVPIFADLTDDMNVGCLGGVTNEGTAQGGTAARMLKVLLKGEELPRKVERHEVSWCFDYEVLKRFGIDLSGLPADSVVINQPSGIWLKHRNLIIGIGALLVLLAVTVLFLGLLLMLKRRHAVELQLAKEKAEQSDRLKSAFLKNISHEIRTPLNAMIGFSNLLQYDSSLDEAAKDSVDHIVKGGYVLRDTISNILEFSRIESGDLEAKLTEVSLGEILRDIRRDDLVDTWGSGRLDIVDETPSGTKVHVDRMMLVKALAHLLHNGFKFSGDRPVSLKCSVENDKIAFVVEDEGIGIENTNLDRVLVPFRKGSPNDSKFFPGAGLGLSITQVYVEAMNGNLTITPGTNGGVKASVLIPIAG